MIRFSTPVPSTGPIPGREDTAHYNVWDYGVVLPDGHATFEDFRSGKREMPAGVAELLQGGVSGLHWDGGPITTADANLLVTHARSSDGHTYGWWVNMAFEAYRQAVSGGSQPSQPAPAPPPYQGSELYESGHEISAKLPKGTKIKAAVGSFETFYAGVRAFELQAERDGVPASGADLRAARDGALAFYAALKSAYDKGLDAIAPEHREDCQIAGDRMWDAFHAARKVARDAKVDGWELVAGDPRRPIFRYSRLNRIAWTALANLTTACGLYGLKGELTASGQREAGYVDAFVPYDSQDPLDVPTTGGGFHVQGAPGESLSDAVGG